MVKALLLKIRRSGSRQSEPASPTESTTSPSQPKGKGHHPSSTAPPRPAGRTATQQPRPSSVYSSSSQKQQSRQHDQKLAGGRIPAVTSTARTTAPETEKDRRLRERYPSSFRRGPY